MAQTTLATTFKDAKIEISIDNSSFTDISGVSNKVEISGGEREVSDTFTAGTDTPIVLSGRRASLDITSNILWTADTAATDAEQIVRAAYEAATSFYIRWMPKGELSGTALYTSTGVGVITTPMYGFGDAASADPMLIEFTCKVPYITASTVA